MVFHKIFVGNYSPFVVLFLANSVLNNCCWCAWSPTGGPIQEVGMTLQFSSEEISFFSRNHLQEIEKQMSAEEFALGKPDVSQVCYNVSMQYVWNLIQRIIHHGPAAPRWPILMWDSNGKLPSGLLQGNFRWFGGFSQCLDITAQSEGLEFAGKYCALEMKLATNSLSLDNNISINTHQPPDIKDVISKLAIIQGWCWPSLCNETEVDTMLHFFKRTTIVQHRIIPGFCQQIQPPDIDVTTIAVISLFSTYGALLIFATIYEFVKFQPWKKTFCEDTYEEMDKRDQILLSFSLYRGAHTLTSDNLPMNEGSWQFLNGLRALSLSWLIIMGLINSMDICPLENWAPLIDFLNNIVIDVFMNAAFSIDTLLLLSAFSTAYTVFQLMSEKRFSVVRYYVHGIWRVTPVLAMTIAFTAGPYFLMHHGPAWPIMSGTRDSCRTDWWKTILYINNLFYTSTDVCIDTSWYLSLEMQFYIVAPIILYSLYKHPILGYLVMAAFSLTTIIVPGVITHVKDLAGFPDFKIVMLRNEAETQSYYLDVAWKPWCRMAPYLVGIAIAYVLHRNRKLKMPFLLVILGWIIASGLGLGLVFGLAHYFIGIHPMSNQVASAIGALSRPVWSAAVGWVLLVCATGQGSYINDFLSWRVFATWSNITYSVIVTHVFPVYAIMLSQQTTFSFSMWLLYLFYFTINILSITICTVWYLAFQAPFIHLERLLWSKCKNSDIST